MSTAAPAAASHARRRWLVDSAAWVPADGEMAYLLSLLTQEEGEAVLAFKFEDDRKRAVISRCARRRAARRAAPLLDRSRAGPAGPQPAAQGQLGRRQPLGPGLRRPRVRPCAPPMRAHARLAPSRPPRLMARRVSSLCLGVPWFEVNIWRTRGRKPFCANSGRLRDGAPNFNFNISHEVRAAGLRAAACKRDAAPTAWRAAGVPTPAARAAGAGATAMPRPWRTAFCYARGR